MTWAKVLPMQSPALSCSQSPPPPPRPPRPPRNPSSALTPPRPSPSLWLRLTGSIDVIPAPPPSRFKYVLVNISTGLVQDQTLWSDPVRTNRRKWWGWAGGGPPGNLGKQAVLSLGKVSPDTGGLMGEKESAASNHLTRGLVPHPPSLEGQLPRQGQMEDLLAFGPVAGRV